MAKISERLSALKVANLKGPGYFADGGNLYFRIAPGDTRGWIFRFTISGRTRDMGLGAYPEISLAAARKAAAKYRELVKEGVDPIEQRRTDRAAHRLATARTLTFDECARQYLTDHEKGWRNDKHREQWRQTLADYASPVFGKLPVAAIDESLVLRALKPIWNDKPATASRLRGRVESVLDWARVHGYRSGENPARWKGHLAHSLPAISKLRRVKHHAALPYTAIGEFTATLRECKDGTARALEFIILTAARSGEAVGATWDEVDFTSKTWIVPEERMKGGASIAFPCALLHSASLSHCTKTAPVNSCSPVPSPTVPCRHGGADAAAAAAARRDGAWLPLDVPRLGGGANELPARRGRNGARPRHSERRRSRLPTRRSV